MPSLASLFFVKVSDLSAVAAAGPSGVLGVLRLVGRECEEEYFWPGDNLLLVVQYLWRTKKVSLFSVAHEREERMLNGDEASAVLILGAEHRPLLPLLEESNHDGGALAAGLVAWGVPRAQAKLAAQDAVALLTQQIGGLDDDTLLIIHVA